MTDIIKLPCIRDNPGETSLEAEIEDMGGIYAGTVWLFIRDPQDDCEAQMWLTKEHAITLRNFLDKFIGDRKKRSIFA